MARFRRRKGDDLPEEKEVQHALWGSVREGIAGLALKATGPDPAKPAFIVLCSALALFGLGFLLQASHAATTVSYEGYQAELIEQARFRSAALICLLMGARLGPQGFRRFVPHLFAISIVLLIAVWIPGIAKPENGADRWVKIMGFSVQPSEIVRITLILWTADRCARLGDRLMDSWRTILPVFLTGILTCLLVFFEPDLGGSFILMMCFFMTLFVGGAPAKKTIFPFGILLAAGIFIAVSTQQYVRDRIAILWGSGGNEQVSDAASAMWSGGLFGQGLGQGLSRRDNLLYQDSDFVFSLIGEELGAVGMLIVIGLFVSIAWFGLKMVLAIPDRFRAITSFGLLLSVLLPALIHMMVAVGLAPPKGMTLPFISDGGTSLIMSSLACGLALGAARSFQRNGASETTSQPTENNLSISR
jgi:cell division protein FtsW